MTNIFCWFHSDHYSIVLHLWQTEQIINCCFFCHRFRQKRGRLPSDRENQPPPGPPPQMNGDRTSPPQGMITLGQRPARLEQSMTPVAQVQFKKDLSQVFVSDNQMLTKSLFEYFVEPKVVK